MNQLQRLIKEKQDLQARLDTLLDAMQGNKETGVQARTLNETELAEIETARGKMQGLTSQIENLQFLEDQKKDRAAGGAPRGIDPGTPAPSEYEKALKGFNLARAAQQVGHKKTPDGLEGEVNQEAVRAAAAAGIPYHGGVMVPFEVLQKRATNGISSSSGNLIPTELLPTVEGYKIEPFARQLGARVITGITGIKTIPVMDLIATAAYAGETATLTEVDPTVRKATLTPKPVVAKIQMTNLIMADAGASVIGGLATETLAAAEVSAVDAAIINGSGDAPTGIFGNTDVPNLDLAAPGNITFADLLAIKNSPGKNNARFINGPRGWVTNEDVRTWLESQQHGTSGRFIWPTETPDMLLGYKAITTSLVPNDGGTGDDESGLIFGIWSNLVIANWAYRELVLDKVSEDSITWFKWYSYWNHALLSPKAFAKCRNILTVETT